MAYVLTPLAGIGALLIALLAFGLYLDVSAFDQTKGCYEAPYEGVTGTPIDWLAMDRTATGLAKRGHILNVLVDG